MLHSTVSGAVCLYVCMCVWRLAKQALPSPHTCPEVLNCTIQLHNTIEVNRHIPKRLTQAFIITLLCVFASNNNDFIPIKLKKKMKIDISNLQPH